MRSFPNSTCTRDIGQMTSRGIRRYTPPLLTSKSLEGLEKVIPPQGYSPSNPDYRNWKFDKPLPDLPRPTSSVYSPDDEATWVIESHMPPCPRNTLIPEAPLRVPSRARSLGFSDRYQKTIHELPTDEDVHLRVRKKSLSLQPGGYQSVPNLLLPTAARASLSAPTGPYHPHFGWSWRLKSKSRSMSTHALHGGSTTADPVLPISHTTIESIGPMLLTPASDFHHHGKDESRESSLAVVDDSVSEMCRCEDLRESVQPRLYSEDGPPDTHKESPQIVDSLLTGRPPATKFARDNPITPLLKIESQHHYRNRTELFSFSSDSSVFDHNLHITPTPNNTPTVLTFDRRRTKQLAVPISDYQHYGPKAWKPKRDRRPSTMFKRRMMKSKLKRTSVLLLPLPPSPTTLHRYNQQSHRYSQSQLQSQCQSQFLSAPLTLLPRRMKTLLSKAFHVRDNITPAKPMRPPRPPSPSPMRYFLPPPPPPPPPPTDQQQDEQQQEQREMKQRNLRGGNLFRRSIAVTRERLGLRLSGPDAQKMTLKDRIVFVGPTDPAATSEERVNEWV